MFAELHRICFGSRIYEIETEHEHNTSNSRTADECKSILIYMTATFVARIYMLATTMRRRFFTHFAVKRRLRKT